MKISDAKAKIGQYLSADIPAFLWGAPGVGKSQAVAQYAAEADIQLIDFRAALREAVDILGLPHVREDGLLHYAPSAELPRSGEGILFLDELNLARQDVLNACMGLVLDRKVGAYELPPGWHIVAASNRRGHKAATSRLPAPLAGRFAHVDIDCDVDEWSRHELSTGGDPVTVGFIRWRPDLIHCMTAEGGAAGGDELRAYPSPRSWSRVGKLHAAGAGMDDQLYAGIVGEGSAAEFCGFLEVYQSLPDPHQVLSDPQGAPVPQGAAAKCAAGAMLTSIATVNAADALFSYLSRFDPEYRVAPVADMLTKCPDLKFSRGYVDYAQSMQGVTY